MTAIPDGPRVAAIRTFVFDVLGTVVDEAGSLRAEARTALTTAGADAGHADDLVAAWLLRHDELLAEVRSGAAAWQPNSALRRVALSQAIAGFGDLPDLVFEGLAMAGYRLQPWADSAAALHRLRAHCTVVALSNATLAELASMSAGGDLAWHCVLSGELVRAYKPDPAVYRLALDRLELDPGHAMMVAAHPWDLRAAAGHGMRTAYIERPGEAAPQPGDAFDLTVADLGELAAIVARG
jgi:2-haloacid dehalogenase